MDGILVTLLPIIVVLITLPQEIHSVQPNIGPVNRGCHFFDPKTPSMPNNRWVDSVDMNIEMCIDHCATNEQTLAGLYNGDVCVCSEMLPTDQVAPSTFCVTMCPGNNGEKCGGTKTVSVYSVCDAFHFGKNCEYLCYCDQKMNCNFMTGICLNNKCDYNHEGVRCDIDKYAPIIKFLQKIAKFLQWLWQQVKGLFVLEEKIPEVCGSGHYGIMCEIPCHCATGYNCDRVTGVCEVTTCAAGWIGRRCDKPNPCDINPCLNNGRCKLVGLKVNCECVQPYSGRNCEIVDPCFKKPCRNNGTCVTVGSKYTCDCTSEFFGERCEAELRYTPDTHVYISCFREEETDREFLKQMKDMDPKQMKPSICSKRCRAKLYTYAGLQVGNECWCSNSVGKYGGLPESECSEPCSGDKKKKCGERNANSVYAGCPIGRYRIDCKGICNCLRDPCDLKTGNCPQERCKLGFTGKRCDMVMNEPSSEYAKKKQYVLLVLVGYTAFIIIETVVFVLQHFRIISRLPIASLTPEGPFLPAQVIPQKDGEEPTEAAPKPLGTAEAADQSPVTNAPTTSGTKDKSPVKVASATARSSAMHTAPPPPPPPPPSAPTVGTVPMPSKRMTEHASVGSTHMMPMQPPFANTPMIPMYDPTALQYSYNAQPMVTAVPSVNMYIPKTAPSAADEKHDEDDDED